MLSICVSNLFPHFALLQVCIKCPLVNISVRSAFVGLSRLGKKDIVYRYATQCWTKELSDEGDVGDGKRGQGGKGEGMCRGRGIGN